jgi:hypothetical protein
MMNSGSDFEFSFFVVGSPARRGLADLDDAAYDSNNFESSAYYNPRKLLTILLVPTFGMTANVSFLLTEIQGGPVISIRVFNKRSFRND